MNRATARILAAAAASTIRPEDRVALYKSGLNVREIAELEGVPPCRVYKYLRARKVTMRRKGWPKGSIRVSYAAAAISLRSEGWKQNAIAAHVGVSHQAISQFFQRVDRNSQIRTRIAPGGISLHLHGKDHAHA